MAENKAVYEGLFIFDANRFARDRDSLSKQVESLITQAGGDVIVSRLWEERRMAYPIKGHRKGAYWLMYFSLPTNGISELTRQCEINDSVLRQMFVRLPASLVEPIVAHAKGETADPAVEQEEEAAETPTPVAVE